MAHDGQDIDGVFGGGAHRVGAGAEEAAAGVMDVLQRILAQNADPVFEGSSWRLHSVNQGCGSGGAGIPHNLVAKRVDGSDGS